MQKLLELYRRWAGCDAQGIDKLAGAGSNRAYYRLRQSDGTTVIGVVGTSREENEAFVYLARHFEEKRLPMPRVLAMSDDGMRYLQTDLGGTSLFDAIAKGRKNGGEYSEKEIELLKRTIRILPEIQIRGGEGLDFAHCYPQPTFDKTNVMFDLNYFKYCFLKATGVDFHEMRLEEDFRRMAKDLDALTGDSTFMYRDFQARNVMLDGDGNPWFIDFQGGRRGPYYYDVASFLWQASARYPQTLRNELIDEYYAKLQTLTAVPEREVFDRRLSLFVLFRTLQVLGAYGFRGYFEQKQHFIDSIPPAIDNLRQLLEADICPYSYLAEVLKNVSAICATEKPSLRGVKSEFTNLKSRVFESKIPSLQQPENQLVVKVFSFSFHKGIPKDESGNGGGYVFDCRATHNPGRYAPYKKLTGLDAEVIKFLEDDGEIIPFLENIYQLADAHVERYIERGFTSLMFSFGCTGGQHRSVYSAQHLAERISRKYGVEVRLCHREQNISQIFEAKELRKENRE